MSATDQKLYAFAYLDTEWVPCGQLTLTEEGTKLLASTFAYGLRYLERPGALEVDPVSLGIGDKTLVRGTALFPPNNLPLFGGIRDAAPDAWGRRVIESRLKVPANSLPESTYLLHAGSQRVGAIDIRSSRDSSATPGFGTWDNFEYLMEAAERIDEGLPVPAPLEEIFADGSALGGARPKATVRDDERVLWLAKFPSRKDGLTGRLPRLNAGAGRCECSRYRLLHQVEHDHGSETDNNRDRTGCQKCAHTVSKSCHPRLTRIAAKAPQIGSVNASVSMAMKTVPRAPTQA